MWPDTPLYDIVKTTATTTHNNNRWRVSFGGSHHTPRVRGASPVSDLVNLGEKPRHEGRSGASQCTYAVQTPSPFPPSPTPLPATGACKCSGLSR